MGETLPLLKFPIRHSTIKRLLQNLQIYTLPIVNTAILLKDGALFDAYRADLDTAYTYSNPTGLPEGLQLGNNSIKGIPKASGIFNISLSASSKGKIRKQTFSLTIKNMEIQVRGDSKIFTNQTSLFRITTRYGKPPVSLSIASGPDFCILQNFSLVCKPIK